MQEKSPRGRADRRTVLKAVSGTALALGAGGVGLSLASATDASETDGHWQTYMHDARKTGHNPDGVGIEGGVAARWTVDRASAVDPVVADGAVYAGETALWALDAADGSQRWSFEFAGGASDTGGRLSALTVAGETVYAGTRDGRLSALAAADGTERWQSGAARWVTGLNVAEGTLFAIENGGMDDGDRLLALEAESGEERWTFEFGDESGTMPRTAPEPAVADGRAYLKADSVHALDVETGETVWTEDEGDYYTLGATLAVADGTVYVSEGPGTGEFRALDATDGSVEWTFDPAFEGVKWSSPVVGERAVYVGQNDKDGTLRYYALNRADGSLEWEIDDFAEEAALAGGVLYLDLRGAGAGLNAVDADDGSRLWSSDDLGDIAGTAVVGDTAYVASSSTTESAGIVALEAVATETESATETDAGTDADPATATEPATETESATATEPDDRLPDSSSGEDCST